MRPCFDVGLAKSSQIKACRPEASPFRAQTKCRILPDQVVYNVKNTKSWFDRIQGASTIQLPPPVQMQYLCSAVSQVQAGRPCFRGPVMLHSRILRVQRSEGKVAT